MSMLKFEIRKIWRQKKLLWLFIVILLCVGALFSQNKSQQADMKERALETIQPYIEESDRLYHYYTMLELEHGLDEQQAQQLVHVNEIGTAFFKWKSAIYNEKWSEIPFIEHDFLNGIQLLEQAGMSFNPLVGMERDKAIQKNEWLRLHQLPYEDEEFPMSPALVLKESTAILLGAAGVFLLMLLFGNTITSEKEKQTWLTLKTQPIEKWQRTTAKYMSLLLVMAVFIAVVFGIGCLVPYVFGEQVWNFNYPQLIHSEDAFKVISTSSYLLRIALLFSCAGTFVFGLIIFLSTRMKSSFSVLMVSSFIGLAGFMVTQLNLSLQTFWNPFQLFRITPIVSEAVQNSFWLYPLSAICWSGLLIMLAILLPKREKEPSRASEQKKPYDSGNTRHIRAVWISAIFEWRKMKRQGLLKQSSVVLALFVLIGYFVIAQIANKKEIEYIEGLNEIIHFYEESWIPHVEQNIASIDERKKEAEESGDEAKIAYYTNDALSQNELLLSFFNEVISNNKMGLKGYEQQDWNSFYNYQLYENRLENGEFDKEFRLNRTRTLSYLTMKASIVEKEWLMEHNVQPVFSGEFIPTIYHNWGDLKKEKKAWEERNRKVDNSGLFSLYLYFDNYMYFIPLLLLLFLVWSGLAGERGKRHTLHLLKTQPIAEKSIFLGKLTNATVVALVIGLGVVVYIVSVGTLFNRFGDWYYPVLHYNSKSLVESAGYTGMRAFEGGFHFMPLGEYLVSSIVLFLLVLLFLIVLSHVLALFIPQSFGVIASVALVSVIGYMASWKLGDFTQFSPFTYLNIAKVVSGEVSVLLNNPAVTALNGCLVLLGVSIFLLLMGYVVLRRRDRVG